MGPLSKMMTLKCLGLKIVFKFTSLWTTWVPGEGLVETSMAVTGECLGASPCLVTEDTPGTLLI